MKINGWIPSLFVFCGLFVSQACFGQPPPPNDNYSNSVALTGTDLTFSGTLAGATLEGSTARGFLEYRETDAYDEDFGTGPATQSVWWNWTAPTSTVLTLQILNSSITASQYQGLDALIIYNATNGSTSTSGLVLPALGARLIDSRLAPQTLSISVTAGINYQIQLIGSSSASYAFRLVATNTPFIVVPPRSQTVYTNASALLYVVAAGLGQMPPAGWDNPTPFTFQWLLNGTNLSGENAPMLALTNIDGSMAGSYSVIVSNAAGYTISRSAALSVTQSNVPVSLAAAGFRSNNFVFSLTGENGRNYRIESSTDLVIWAPEPSFLMGPGWPQLTSVVFNSNSPLVLTVTNNAARKFIRATPYVINDSDAEICINHLRQIRIAKLLWQRDNIQSALNQPVFSDLYTYFPHQVAPFCPDDSTQSVFDSYLAGNLQYEPACYIKPDTHVLEDPQ